MKTYSLLLAFLLAAFLPLAAQNNPYEIDDECFVFFQRAEASANARTAEDEAEFEEASSGLLRTALAKGDRKAQTLYYVVRLKHAVHTPGVTNAEVDAEHEKLCSVARELGYMQYYYYAYELAQNYYYNTGQSIRAMEMLLAMTEQAHEENDEYGVWVGNRYLGSLYQAMNDYVTAKRYIEASLRVYQQSTDPTLKRQSVTRQYTDLSDCYPVGSDSMRINVAKAVESSRVHLDTLRSEYYLAKVAAMDKDEKAFRQHRDYCLKDRQFPGTLFQNGVEYFEAIESLMQGDPEKHMEAFDALKRYPQQKFIADLAETFGFHEVSMHVHHQMIRRLEEVISSTNSMRLSELDARMGNQSLSAEVAEQSSRIARISRLVLALLALILLASLIFSWIHIRNLKRNRERDAQRIAELKAANERVRIADEAKTRFVQNMSHEVRTPLNAIVGFSQLLSLPDGTFPPEEKDEFAGHIVNNTKMLTMLLDDILNATDMDAGNYSIHLEEGECHFICQAAISSAEHRLQPGVRLYYAPEREEPFTFRTDPRRVQQILINLLTNACKHTTSGEIRLSSSLSEHPGQVTFSVTDTGPGIPADKAEHIFDRFTKLDEFVQGTGLGLSICRDIAGRMGGRVWLDTSYTGGARFVFTVPVDPDAPADH